jgi:hypothetical protein
MVSGFRAIRPGDISRPHCADFDTDPLRMIRNLGATLEKKGDCKKPKGEFELIFKGRTGTPWKQIMPTVRYLVRSSGTVKIQYDAFSSYFNLLRTSRYGGNIKGLNCFKNKWRNLCVSRISGNIATVQDIHKDLLLLIDSCGTMILLDKDMIGIWPTRREELEQALPREVDISKFGYNEIDAALIAWKNRDREAIKKEKEGKKRKEAEDDQGGRSAKRRAGDGGL